MKQFELILKNEKEVSYKRISILLLVLNLVGILFITYLKDFKSWVPFIMAAIAVFAALISFYFRNKNEKATLTGAFFVLSLAWILADYWLVGLLNTLFMVLHIAALQKPIVTINESQVTYPSFPKKKIDWQELSNLMIKDGLLTIDFKNNRIIQQQIADISSTLDEKEFNDFCRQQLNK
jgi:Zn-dependent protease with chaperone function